MKTYEATEQAYKNGYAQGYKDGKRDAVKHGWWIYKPFASDEDVWLNHCSECDAPNARKRNHCPECGAKMDLPSGTDQPITDQTKAALEAMGRKAHGEE